MGPQEIDSHVEILQVILGIVFSRRLHLALALPIQPSGILEEYQVLRIYKVQGKGTFKHLGQQHSFFLFFSVR